MCPSDMYFLCYCIFMLLLDTSIHYTATLCLILVICFLFTRPSAMSFWFDSFIPMIPFCSHAG